jgi:hypothetical protein
MRNHVAILALGCGRVSDSSSAALEMQIGISFVLSHLVLILYLDSDPILYRPMSGNWFANGLQTNEGFSTSVVAT